MTFSLKAKLSLAIVMVVLLTVALISLLFNVFIQNQFKSYISTQQENAMREIVRSISRQYDETDKAWDLNFIHTIGMYALYDGYIVKVYDENKNVLWDAEACDMRLCTQVMDDISHRMMSEYPAMNGKFMTRTFPAVQGGKEIGTVSVSYFGPYFLSKEDFHFLDALNIILVGTAILSLAVSIIVGVIMARRLSRPIMKTVGVTREISKGNYGARIQEYSGTSEVDELMDSINHMAESLDKQETLRRQLTADVAHELRTPLTTIQTHMEAIIEGVWEPSRERMESLYDEMKRLGILVSDLENLAKVESGSLKLNHTLINLSDLLKKALAGFEKEIANKNLNVSILGNCSEIYADRDRISQVLINLISNAVKYTPDRGEITITFSELDDSVIFMIEDTGIGIPEEELPYIFERFYRAEKSRSRSTGGSGIGLAIVRSIVSAHGGIVEADSRLNRGSSFMVSLPKERKI